MKKTLDIIEKIISIFIILLMISMAVILVYQVILRYVFNRSNNWTEEYARFALVWMCCYGSAIAFRRYRHITITTISDMLPQKIMRYVDILMYLITMVFLGVVLWQGIHYTLNNINKITTGLQISQGLVYTCLPISAALMEIFLIECIVDKVKALKCNCIDEKKEDKA